MKRLLYPLIIAALANAADITQLLNAVKNIPDTKIDNLMIKEMKTNKKSVQNSLLPTVTLTGSAEHFNSPVSLKPITPTLSGMLLKTDSSIPFSQNMEKLGFNITMPLFIKEIYDNKAKMSYLVTATKYQAKINLLKREALVVTLISKLNYLYSLKKALLTQENSIKQTIKAIQVGVNVGRIPEFKLLRLKDSLNQIKISVINLNTNIIDLQSQIYNLTKIKVNSPVKFSSYNISKGEFIALKPLKEKVISDSYDIKAQKDRYLPKFILKIQGYRAFGKAYNNGQSVAENLASAGIYVSWDIFNKKNSSYIQKAKINRMKNTLEIQKTVLDLTSEIEKIDKSVKEIKKSLLLSLKNISLKKQLLKSATVAFKLNQMTVDEYLQYENDLAKAKAEYANLIATLNSLKAQKAFIYGKNLKKVFK